MDRELEGIIPALITPFNEKGEVDGESLRRLVAHCIEVGAHGLAIMGTVGEFTMLNEDERREITQAVVREVDGKVPVVVGTTSTSAREAAELSNYAAEAGADAVFSTKPYNQEPSDQQILDYYRAISEAVDIPVIIAETATSTIDSSLIVRMAEELDKVRYVKEEAVLAGHKAAEILRLSRGRLKVFTGSGGRSIIADLERGAVGVMPGCVLIKALCGIYEQWKRGNIAAARAELNRIAPLILFRSQSPIPVTKEILQRKGIIKSSAMREPALSILDAYDVREPLDEYDLKELTAILRTVVDYE